MKRKKIILIVLIAILLIIAILGIITSKKNSNVVITNENQNLYEYDRKDEEYVVYDKAGQEIYRTKDKTELHKWEVNPDYNLEMTPYATTSSEETEEI